MIANTTGTGGGAVGLTKLGANTLVLSGANTYTGLTTLGGGTLSLGNATALGGGGNITFVGGTLQYTSSNAKDYSAKIVNSTSAVSLDVNGQSVNYASSLGNTSTGGLVLLDSAGGGTLTLTASNAYTGTTTISSGTLQLGNGTTNGSISSTSIVDYGALVFDPNSAIIYAGVVSGNGSLTQAGTTTVTLNQAQTYTGATNVSAGTLIIDHGPSNTGNLSTTSGVTVSTGATLLVKGATSLGGTLNNSGNLSLNDGAIGTVMVGGNLTLNTATVNEDISSLGTSDLLAVTGTATISGTDTINLYGSLTLGNYTLITAASGLGNATSFVIGAKPSGFYNLSLGSYSTGTAVILTVTGNPTPANAYWTGIASAANGDTNNNWGNGTTSSNWSSTVDGGNDTLQVPGATSNVFFTAANAPGGALATQLDASYAIKSLTFDTSPDVNSIPSVTINLNGKSLTLGSGGLTLASASTSTATISGNGGVVIGSSQSWSNNNTSESLTVGAAISAVSANTTLSISGTGNGGVTLSGPMTDGSGQLALVFNQAGTTVLGGVNSYSGGTTLSSGTVQMSGTGTLGNTSAPLTVNGGTLDLNSTSQMVGPLAGTGGTILNNGGNTSTLTVNSGGNTSYAGTLANGSGVLAFTKTGAGILTLSGSNSYTGNIAINAGTIQVNSGASLSGGIGTLTIGTGSAGTIGTIGNLTLNASASVGSFSVVSNTANATSPSNINQLSIASGSTVTVGGSMVVGVAASASGNTSTALGTGSTPGAGGNLAVNGNVSIGLAATDPAGITTAVADLSGLSNFNQTATSGFLRVGYDQTDQGTLNLAANNTINVGTISVGDSNGNNTASTTVANILNLGSGSNTLEANTINLGIRKAGGLIQFASGNGTLTITGTGGTGTANITVGNGTNNTYQFTGTNGLLLAGHNVSVSAGTVIVAERNGSTGSAPTSSITFDTGNFTASNLELGVDAAAGFNGGGTPTGNFTLGTSSSSTGVLTVNTAFYLADNNDATASDNAVGNFIVLGGTATINTNITVPSTKGTSTTALTLNGGTLNMTGHYIGGGGNNTSGNSTITNLNFQSGTLENVAQINGGAPLVKTTGGTLILTGSNAYTGGTTISAGTVLANSSDSVVGSTGSGLVNVTSAGTLGGAGNILGNVAVKGTITAGSSATTGSPGTLTINGLAATTTLAGNGTYSVKINSTSSSGTAGTNWDQLVLSGLAVTAANGSPFNVSLVSLNAGNTSGAVPGFTPTSSDSWVIATSTAASVSGITPDGGNTTILATDGGIGAPMVSGNNTGIFALNTASFASLNGTTSSTGYFALELVGSSGSYDLDVVYNAAPEPGVLLLTIAGVVPMLLTRKRRQRPLQLP